MTLALILFCALLAAGCVLYIHHRLTGGDKDADLPSAGQLPSDVSGADDGCCGMHVTCERDSLLSAVSSEIEYFDDEELDRFAGRDSAMYGDAEIEEFREILLTMPADNIAAWARSLQLRGINLPADVREELLLIVSETRRERSHAASVAAVK